ncbi:DNA/RNA non-specific endonuclease [Clostridium estertheticum]|uniref:DNA/RNA non-specific endonuclease n=1 Tax=Clostridium estertheticum TaxID=238834 RepID=A0AA47EL20_9CLOT|nr:DNA/RNA non-specific endonuclease [Clostridium estertheticum]MBU3157994.1 DNA/RNA non-specific endonuclease [Clostridium estertheticum]WAG62161.1 DNA/RNA non-specific endonuclease [Clostridium estertheticum]
MDVKEKSRSFQDVNMTCDELIGKILKDYSGYSFTQCIAEGQKIENQWASAIKEGKSVKVNGEVKYDGDSLRPLEFNVQYEIDGKHFVSDILN